MKRPEYTRAYALALRSVSAFGRTSEFCFSKKKKNKKEKIEKIEKEDKRQKPVIGGSTIRQKNSNYRARSRNH